MPRPPLCARGRIRFPVLYFGRVYGPLDGVSSERTSEHPVILPLWSHLDPPPYQCPHGATPSSGWEPLSVNLRERPRARDANALSWRSPSAPPM